jgi:hypothetical protein
MVTPLQGTACFRARQLPQPDRRPDDAVGAYALGCWKSAGKRQFYTPNRQLRPGAGPGLSWRFGVEPPAGIEPATPSLPLTLGWLTTPCGTPRRRTTAEVNSAVEVGVVGYGEVACGAVSGKFLAPACVVACADPVDA